MDSTSTMGSLIGFDAAALGFQGAVNRGRRSTDRVDGSAFAEVYDLAAYATTGSRAAARVAAPAPLQAVPNPAGLGPVPTSLAPADQMAAERLYLHLSSGSSWMRGADAQSGAVVMRLHDADGTAVRELRVTELGGHDDGPEVA